MIYNHLKSIKFVMIEVYFNYLQSVLKVADLLLRSRQLIITCIVFLKLVVMQLVSTNNIRKTKITTADNFKSITFYCGKEFSNWKNSSNINDVSISFTDLGTPSQQLLNEHSNGLLRKNGLCLYKVMNFNGVSE